jgi:hypothetical protein
VRLVIVRVIIILYWLIASAASSMANSASLSPYSQSVNKILDKKVSVVEQIAQQKTILDTLRNANIVNQSQSMRDLESIDKAWQAKNHLSSKVVDLLTHPCSKLLRQQQKQYPEFVEIMVTDKYGFIVCMTNKTSDYYQADEDWWQQAYHQTQDKVHYGAIEYDESAYSEAIPLYLPVRDEKDTQVIGVIKVVVDVLFVKQELR